MHYFSMAFFSDRLLVTAAGGCAPLGCQAGRTHTPAPAPSERARPGKTWAGTVPCGALHIWLVCGLSCCPANTHPPCSCEVMQRQKCALCFCVEAEALAARLAFIEGRWTPLPQMPKRSGLPQGWRVKA